MFSESSFTHLRQKTASQILYIIVTSTSKSKDPFFKPDINTEPLTKVYDLPKDILVLDNSLNYFIFNINLVKKVGYNLNFTPDYSLLGDNENNFISMISTLYDLSSQLTVFLIDEQCQKFDRILDNVAKINSSFIYYTTYNHLPNSHREKSKNNFNNSIEFIKLLKSNIDNIRKMLVQKTRNKDYYGFEINLNHEFHKDAINENVFSDFTAS